MLVINTDTELKGFYQHIILLFNRVRVPVCNQYGDYLINKFKRIFALVFV